MNWIELNNQVIIKDEFGRYQLEKDKEALKSYIEEYVTPKLMKFNSLEERLSYLIKNNYYSKEVINKYTVEFINKHKIQGLKIHSCYVVKNTALCDMYEKGEYLPLTLEEYLESAAYVLTHINPYIVIHRISGDAPKALLVAPNWNSHKKWIMNGLDKLLREKNLWQGMEYTDTQQKSSLK